MADQHLSELLQQFSPFDQLQPAFLDQLSRHIQLKRCPIDTTLFQLDSFDAEEIYLLKGRIKLVAKDGRESSLSADEAKARYPIARLRPRMYTGKAATELEYFTLGRPVIDLLQSKTLAADDRLRLAGKPAGGGDQGHALLYEFQQELNQGRFTIPSLPEVANKIRQCADDPDSGLAELAKLINTDPAIAAKLIRTANSALYGGASPFKDTLSAIARLGLETTKQLVTSFAALSLFSSDCEQFNREMQQLWRRSIEVAAYSYILAQQLPTLNEEEAMLAGLLHLIGEQSILAYASRFYDLNTDEQQLHAVRMQLRGHIGALVLAKWGFAEELVVVPRELDNWLRDSDEEFDYCDLVQIASLYACRANGGEPSLPDLQAIPAARKLALSQQQTEHIIREAEQQISEIRSWFH